MLLFYWIICFFTFYLLVIAHLISDFILQSNLALKKSRINRYMTAHCAIATFAFLIPLLNYPLGKSLLGALIIFISHLVIDNLKKSADLLFKLNPEKYLS